MRARAEAARERGPVERVPLGGQRRVEEPRAALVRARRLSPEEAARAGLR